MVKVVISTRNKDKLREIEDILDGLPVEICSLFDYPFIPLIEENGATLVENALKKATYVHDVTSRWCIADDTGLFVDILGGAPGVRSARFAGEEATYEQNRKKLLSALEDVPLERRTARFVCCTALVVDSDRKEVFEGIVEGYITEKEIGSRGFGYDSIFMLPKIGKTFAELSLEKKNKFSHRAIALRRLRVRLKGLLSIVNNQ
jgi:XTP/dITP diphosphohydrolase